MNFLWPSIWILSLLAIIPLLLLYLIRQRSRQLHISTLLFWDQIAPQNRTSPLWRKLRRWVSWLLQVLFLLLLLFALSQPFLQKHHREGTDLVLIIDGSPSMQANDGQQHVWEILIRRAGSILGQLRSNDQAMILQSGVDPVVVFPWSPNRRDLNLALQRLTPDSHPSSIDKTLELAHNLVQDNPRGRILLFSDRVWERLPDPSLLDNVEIHTHLLQGSNAAITAFAARRSFQLPGQYQLHAEVVYQGTEPWQGEVHLWRNQRLVDIQPVELEPGTTWQHQWQHQSLAEQHYRIELTGTDGHLLQSDKTATLTLPATPVRHVAVYGNPDPFLLRALQAIPNVELLAHSSYSDDETTATRTVLPDLQIFMGSPPDRESIPASIPTLLIQPEGSGFWGELLQANPVPVILDWDRSHPLLNHVDIGGLQIGSSQSYTPPAGVDLLIHGVQDPLLYGQWDHSSQWLLMTFGLHESNLVFRTAFPIFLSNLLQSLSADSDIPQAALPGKTESMLVALELPDNQISSHSNSLAPTRALLSFPLWWWALILGTLWVLIEWQTYHRRWTE